MAYGQPFFVEVVLLACCNIIRLVFVFVSQGQRPSFSAWKAFSSCASPSLSVDEGLRASFDLYGFLHRINGKRKHNNIVGFYMQNKGL